MKNLSIIVPLYNKENVICKTLDLIIKKCDQAMRSMDQEGDVSISSLIAYMLVNRSLSQ